MNKIRLQEYADRIIDEKYRRPLSTLTEALNFHGWPDVDRPTCCGAEVEIKSFIGSAYFAQCQTCRKFIVDPTGPQFGNGHVNLIDPDKVDVDTDRRWIAGTESCS